MADQYARDIRKDALDRALQLNFAPMDPTADAEQIVKDARLFEAYINEDRHGHGTHGMG